MIARRFFQVNSRAWASCCVEGSEDTDTPSGMDAQEMVAGDPLLTTGLDRPYSFREGSPCRDAGKNRYVAAWVETDIRGCERFRVSSTGDRRVRAKRRSWISGSTSTG